MQEARQRRAAPGAPADRNPRPHAERGARMHTFLMTLGWCAIAATLVWGITFRRAAVTIAALRSDCRREVQYWQEAAERARTHAAQLDAERASWSAGCRQGREDVVSIVPMLLAARDQRNCGCQDGISSS
jgi:hypothetical protein